MSNQADEQSRPKLEELEAPAQELNPEESAAVTGGMKNARKAKTAEAINFVAPTDLAEE